MSLKKQVGNQARKALNDSKRIMTDRVDRCMRAVALEAQSRIMQRTPVDTGRARANWNTTTGAPDFSTNPDATRADVGTKRKAGASTIRATEFVRGERIYIANGLEYIDALENGHSSKSPQGMVAITQAELKPLLEEIAAKILRESADE